jgi:membrane-associated phospholipid phosphatase
MAAAGEKQNTWSWVLALLAPTLGLALLAAAALSVDRDLGLAIREGAAPRLLTEVCLNLDSFGHLVGVMAVAGAVWILAPGGGRIAGLMLISAVSAGSMANLVKLCVHRCRPRDLQIWNTVWDSFAAIPPAPHIKLHSFPSSHTTVAFAASAILAAAFPKARWYVWLLAIGAGSGRVLRQAHFPSDALAGAALGYAVGFLVAHAGARWLRQPSGQASDERSAGDEPLARVEPAGTSCPILPTRRAG